MESLFKSSTVQTQNKNIKKHLKFAMLGCEMDPPYGPNPSIGQMFLELIHKAHIYSISTTETEEEEQNKVLTNNEVVELSTKIDIFQVQKSQYPTDYDMYDGMLIPGSVHSAADTNQKWIQELKKVINEEIHGKYRTTLGMCFGHQILANYMYNDYVIPCPYGSQAGIISSPLILYNDKQQNIPHPFQQYTTLKLFYTHGDMVCKLPSNAIPLSQSTHVPYQSIAYYNPTTNKPYAFSFQAHLEYAASDHGIATYKNCVKMMESKKYIDSNVVDKCNNDIDDNLDSVRDCSIRLMVIVGRNLGWFT